MIPCVLFKCSLMLLCHPSFSFCIVLVTYTLPCQAYKKYWVVYSVYQTLHSVQMYHLEVNTTAIPIKLRRQLI